MRVKTRQIITHLGIIGMTAESIYSENLSSYFVRRPKIDTSFSPLSKRAPKVVGAQ